MIPVAHRPEAGPPARVRLTLEDDEETAHFERAVAENGWAMRGRK